MKGIATVNFKGGVGKTTVTWLLAKYAAEKGKRVLVVDTDAQMSLTLAVQLQESGAMYGEFEKCYENQHRKRNKTILNALEKYDRMEGGHFDFPIDASFIYPMSENLHFIPSVVDLYWLELEVFDREKLKHFIRALLGKIEHARGFNYDYVFFDCPPNFTALSYSVLSCSSLILIPVNPDVFASRGIGLMIDGLRYRIQPWPDLKIAVFMNKAKLYKGNLPRETERYWTESKVVCDDKRREVEALSKENESKQTKSRQSEEDLPSDDELRSEYDRLYQDFISSNSGVVEEFIKSKSKTYLKAFCRANNLPVDIRYLRLKLWIWFYLNTTPRALPPWLNTDNDLLSSAGCIPIGM